MNKIPAFGKMPQIAVKINNKKVNNINFLTARSVIEKYDKFVPLTEIPAVDYGKIVLEQLKFLQKQNLPIIRLY